MAATFVELSAPCLSDDTGLRKAYRQFIEELDEKEKNLYSSTTLEELLLNVHDVDRRYSAKNMTRSLGQRLQPILYNLDRYGRSLDVFVQMQFTPLSLLWGSLRAILEVGSTFVQYFDLLVNMLEKLCNSFNLFRQYEELLGEDTRLQEALCKFYYQMLVFLRKAKKTFAKSGYTILFRSLWRTFESDYKSILKALANDTTRLTEEISLAWKKKVFRRIDQQGEKQNLLYEKMAARVDHLSIREKILEWLTASDMTSVFERETRRKSQSSGRWCLEHRVFIEWMGHNNNRLLWVRGKPGAGKTVLSTSIISYIQQQTAGNAGKAVAYFFCNRNEKDAQTLLSILSTIIRQLVVSSDEIPESLLSAYRASTKNGRLKISLADQPQHILTALAATKELYLIMDGIDECEDALAAIETAKTLLDGASRTRICLLSRDLPYLREELSLCQCIHVEADQTRADLDGFLYERVNGLDLPAQLRGEIFSKLSADANGMFLWAHLMLQALENATSIVELRKIIQNLPAGLDTTYARIIQGISSQSAPRVELARKTFLWVCRASRPLNWSELQIALVQDPGCTINDDALPFKKVVLELCSPLIEYDAELNIFRPTHYSVKEFLTTSGNGERFENIAPLISSKSSESHTEMARVCISVLEALFTEQGDTPSTLPLVEYAIEFWCQHVLSAEFGNSLCEEILSFLSHSSRRSDWIARYLFQKQKDFPLQRLFRVREQLQEWMAPRSADPSRPAIVLDWMQDVIQLLVKSDDYLLQHSSSAEPSQRMRYQVSYFEKLMVVRDLSRTYTMTGRLPEAISFMLDALRLYTSSKQSTPIEGVWVLNSLGILYDQQKRTELAIETQQEALALQEQYRGAEHMETVWTINELGRLYRHAGDLDNAVGMHERALGVLLREVGPFDLQVTWTLNTLARALRKQQRYEEAIAMHERAIEAQKASLGEKHPHVLWARSDIARCKSHMGLLEDASHLFQEVLDGRRQVLGHNHADTLWSVNDLALVMTSLGRYDNAKAMHEEALRGQANILGEGHEHTIWTKQRLAEFAGRH